MATTTTTQTKAAPNLAQKVALGLLSSFPTTNPAIRAIRKSLPLLPPSIVPNLPNLGNGQSSVMAATFGAGTGAQNPATNGNNNANNTNQNNMCDVCVWPLVLSGSVSHPSFIELPPAPQVARPRLRGITQLLFEGLREGKRCCDQLRGTVLLHEWSSH